MKLIFGAVCPPLLLLLSLGSTSAFGEDDKGWVGTQVVTKQRTPLKMSGAVVDSGEIFRIYTVRQMQGDSLMVVSGSAGNASGWIKKDDVVAFDRSIAYFTQQIETKPTAAAFNMRGQIWGRKRQLDHAIADYNEAIRLDPKEAWQYNNRGIVWSEKKDYLQATADFDKAVQLDPKNPWYYNNRAWLWATCPDAKFRDGKKAVESATRAGKLTEWKEGQKLGTLAAAYAESGDFEAAIKWQNQALGLYPADDAELKTMGTKLLELYKVKKPYRHHTGPDS